MFFNSGLKQQYGIDFSMGIRIFNTLPKDCEDCEDATDQADQLMYQAKALGKSQTTICFA